MRTKLSALTTTAIVLSGAFVFHAATARDAHANAFEVPENGPDLMGRAGAWVARADHALAVAYNPAGLAGLAAGGTLSASLIWQSMCFQRAGTYGTGGSTSDTIFRSGYQGQPYPEVCKLNGVRDVNIVPQVAANYPITDRIGIGLALVTPSGTGRAQWPDVVDTAGGRAPSPQRYLLITKDGVIAQPTIGAGFEIAPGVRLGASFQMVLAQLKVGNMARASNSSAGDVAEGPSADLRADVTVKKFFTPAFVLGAMYEPEGSNIDLGLMFRWSAPIRATSGDVVVEGPYYGSNTSAQSRFVTTNVKLKEFEIAQPWELRLGARYKAPRPDINVADQKKKRLDFLHNYAWDLELDLVYSRDSMVDQVKVLFDPGVNVGFGTNPALCCIPADASVPHSWRDTVAARLGGEWAAVRDVLGVRGGVFAQTAAQKGEYINIDFLASAMFGVYAGATIRATKWLDFSAALGFVFQQTLDSKGAGAVRGLNAFERPGAGVCDADSPPIHRSCKAVNNGTLAGHYKMMSIGATIHL